MRFRAGYDESTDWEKIGTFGAGLVIGLALGAGAALLFAPRTGEETREILGERARRLGNDMSDRWDDLRGGVRKAARRGRRKVRRGLTRGRWAVEDVADRY
jgi:gas vesicle protein